ncbi:MAG TPA: hypothetical protein VES93_10740, partial [Ornithinibacter sp.]|nr:hypothetical protein [Ornithinibacter sp.]
DQDDRWYPDKLERLVPLLDDAVLCSARWRVVDAARSATPPRRRHGFSLAGVLAQNPVPGAAMVFRRTLLDWALPFPDSAAPTAAHDHWLLACAAAVDSCPVSPDVLQDYVQHGGNVIGHERQGGIVDPLRTRFSWTLRRARHPRRLVAEAERLSFGWRRVMAQALAERLTAADLHEHGPTLRAYAGARRLPVYRELARSCYRGDLRFPTALTFVVGSFPGATDSGER